ncbi:calcium-binding protein [Desulforhopalus vacuolatus]|uniref:calcium-binding protein n=1 Tax=Desulforhopalus vacuolatus TaxID=40414 RepID=UPI0019644DBE|nr:calcium-binding protein [Desulforhopalus vacuolatus]MBM9521242.1 calcium-binding protein [Desulforhopalus vacuolatus]
MAKIEKDDDREYRIDMKVVVDAYNSEERAMGWYYYVSDECEFPFKARCTEIRRKSPLDLNDEVEVLEISPAEECEREIFIDIKWNNRKLAVPLSQIEGLDIDDKTREVIDDWHYWVKRRYAF